MLRTRVQLVNEAERLFDAGLAFLALTFATLVRRQMSGWWPDVFPLFDFWPEAGWLYVVLILLWASLFDIFHLYGQQAAASRAYSLRAIFQSNVAGVVLAFFLFYILSIKIVPRMLILLFATFDVLLMYFKEAVLLRFESHWRPQKNLLLAGDPAAFSDFLQRVQQAEVWKAHVVGLVHPPQADPVETPADIPTLGSFGNLAEVLHEQAIDFVVLSPSREHFDEVQEIISLCETEGVETWLLGSLFTTTIAKPRVDEFQDLPMLTFSTTPSLSWALVVKRAIDLLGSLVLTVLTAPLMLACAVAIKLTSPGPVLFRQQRCTLYGRPFWMYKFRTMVSEAEQLRAELQTRNEVEGPVFKMRDDPRVTRVGRLMRRYSLDELPQLFNVIRGEMSLVGPRPPIPQEVEAYANWQRRRLSMRSGITCIWQTAGRNAVGFEDWMRLDLEYIDNWSLALDLKILVKTPFTVLRGTGF